MSTKKRPANSSINSPRSVAKKDGARRSGDPWREREAAKYASPIVSREFILSKLETHGVPIADADLAIELGIPVKEEVAFSRRIGAMLRDGQLLRNRKGALLVARKTGLVSGRIQAHPDGYGFLVPDEGDEDLHLPHREMRNAMHGDKALVRPGALDRRGRREASIVEITERAHSRLVGRLHRDGEFLLVTPSERRITHEVLVSAANSGGANPGQVVVVDLLSPPAVDDRTGQYSPPVGKVVEVLGNATDSGMEIEIALRKHELPFEFSEKAREQAEGYATSIRPSDLKGRADLREMPLVTIDGETARDFDDAVFCEESGKGFRLVVAIADVSHYVKPNDALDRDARERGTSVYFPRRVIPMLPEALSNGLCSLNPEVDRLCIACDMVISPAGTIRRFRFYNAVMRSRARLTYTQVAAALAEGSSQLDPTVKPLLHELRRMERVFKVLAGARAKRGALDLDTIEAQFVFNADGRVASIQPVKRNDAHRLIEECMLAANVCAARFLEEQGQKLLYRVHEGPTPEKLQNLREFLKAFGLQLGGGAKPQPKDYAQLIESAHARPEIGLIQMVLLRSLRQAVYSPENAGHFGLAYEAYTHFTSPIRRYPDLLVHRAIKAALEGREPLAGNFVEIGRHCSETERRADEATREVDAWLKCHYMKDKVGESYQGTVTAATGFGLFISLDGVYVEGLLHISELGRDYFRFDPIKHQLLGERGNQRYRIGDKIAVRVARVDLETSRIDLVMA